jgi:hypothetical protein
MFAHILSEDSTEHSTRVVFNLLLSSLMIIALILAADPVMAMYAAVSSRATPEPLQTVRLEVPRPVAAPIDAAPPLPQASEPTVAAETLTPRMRAVLDHVTRRYRVSPEALLPIFRAAQSSARDRRLDPLLIVAVIGIESGFNPFSESAMGALGLMQVMPRFHQDKLPPGAEKSHFLDPITNVRIGSHVLQESIDRNGGLIAGLQQFGGAINDEGQAYANKVLAEKERLEQAARRTGESGVYRRMADETSPP